MRFLLLLFFIFFLYQESFSQDEGARFVKGRLTDTLTGDPVKFATIQIKNRHLGTSATENGTFKIPVQIGDTVRFSSVGYESMEIQVDETLLESIKEEWKLLMTPAVYELDSVVVFQMTDGFYLKRKKGKPIEMEGISPSTENPIDWTVPQTSYGGPGMTAGVTISGLLNLVDKRIRQQKKIDQIEEAKAFQASRKEKIGSKFNSELVKTITGIDDRVIDEFMDFCSFTDGFILHATEYEITFEILKKYEAFLRR